MRASTNQITHFHTCEVEPADTGIGNLFDFCFESESSLGLEPRTATTFFPCSF